MTQQADEPTLANGSWQSTPETKSCATVNDSVTGCDPQRVGLRALMVLVQECSAMEPRIEGQYRTISSHTDEKEQQSLATLENSLRHAMQQIAQEFQRRNEQIDARLAGESRDVVTETANAQKRANKEYQSVQESLKKKLAEVVWLADIELEAEQNRQRVALQESEAANAAKMAGKRDRCFALLRKYGHSLEQETALAGEVPKLPESPQKTSPDRQILQAQYDRCVVDVDRCLEVLDQIGLARFFAGVGPYLLFAVVVLLVAGFSQLLPGEALPNWNLLGICGGGAVLVMSVLMLTLRWMARKAVRQSYLPLHNALFYAESTGRELSAATRAWHDSIVSQARAKHKAEIQLQREKESPIQEKAKASRDTTLAAISGEGNAKLDRLTQQHAAEQQQIVQWRDGRLAEIQQKYQHELGKITQTAARTRSEATADHTKARAELEQKWALGLDRIKAPIGEHAADGATGLCGSAEWIAPSAFPASVRFGALEVDVQRLVRDAAPDGPFTLPVPPPFAVPALLEFPRRGSLLIHADRAGRPRALAALQALMTRLLTAVPPGRARFTLIDPVGLGQNFAGFMHLTDYDEALVNGRIWTSPEQIDQRLTDLTEHMETVIQKYLRNEYETIDDYNRQAGDLAEPYRFLVIADLPTGFSDESLNRLSSIATTGARCGVYTLIFRDTRVTVPSGTHLDDLEAHSINLFFKDDCFVWRDDVFSQFPLLLDAAPDEDELTKILHLVGDKARLAKRVEVSFATIAPAPAEFWTRHADRDLQVPIGRCGATRLQTFALGRGVAQHALVTGKTGSGKSTLLHALISNLAMWYAPAELELYLIDFKKGVEFKTYAAHQLPHARAIGVESDREFGLSVLQRIDAEMSRRGDMFRTAGVQDLGSYREATGKSMPRTLLIIDEFQEFFSEDDKLAQDAALLLDRLVRQGRAFGVHVVLGSQTIAGSSGLSRSTIGQIAVRIALQTTEADSQAVLADGNSAARLLTRPGEAIYNDAGGLVEGNSPFQVAWLSDGQRDGYLESVSEKERQAAIHADAAIVFEGNSPADIRKNPLLQAALNSPQAVAVPRFWLGEPVAIKDPTTVIFRRQSGGNLLLIGQAEEQALAIMAAALVALSAQQGAQTMFYVLDGSAADSPSFGVLGSVADRTSHPHQNVEYRNVTETINQLATELKRRQNDAAAQPPGIFVFILGLQRFRVLRKSEESFGFSSGEENAPPDPGKQFAELLTEGPALGIHVLTWVDTMVSMERAMNRNLMREFDNRILFQMSAADSSNLIDSPAANRLGACRALAYSEEQGTLEKFRPYAMPDETFLEEACAKLATRSEPEKETN